MPDERNGTSIPEHQNPESGNGDQNDNIPDWMKEAGWETDSGTFDESKPVFDDLDDDEEEILPADIPAWLEEAAPEGFSSDPDAIPAFEGLDVDEPFITTGDLVPPPSLETPAEEVEPESTPKEAPQDPAEFDIPSWLENLEIDEDSQETAIAWLENMPESLRATEEELEAAQQLSVPEPEEIDEPEDELAWVDEIGLDPAGTAAAEVPDAELSEDLVASELLPESGQEDQIFQQDEIQSMDSDLPSWLKELGDDQPLPADQTAEESVQLDDVPDESPPKPQESMPDWLQSPDESPSPTAEMEAEPAEDPVSALPSEKGDEIPDWLGEFEADTPEDPEPAESLDWLDSIGADESSPEVSETAHPESSAEERSAADPSFAEELDEDLTPDSIEPTPQFPGYDDVSPHDETLNAQVPEWLSKIGELGEDTAEESATIDSIAAEAEAPAAVPESEFESSSSWLDQIDEKSLEVSEEDLVSQEKEVVDWLQEMEDQPEVQAEGLEELAPDASEDQPPAESLYQELESEKFLAAEEESPASGPDDMPDWLSELGQDEEPSQSLEDAIRSTDHELNEEELDFLNRIEEKQEEESDWLSKLDPTELPPESAAIPAPQDDFIMPAEPGEEETDESIVSGGMLDRLKDTAEFRRGEDVPDWLSDIKEEEDPQETAVLWLQQFVNQDGKIDIQDEIKRYTDELDPGTAVPKWMEDLKNEEDPQTTAMLWLEKLAGQQSQADQESAAEQVEDSGWLADLDREAAAGPAGEAAEEISDFDDPDQGWLSDLDLDEKLKTDEDLPEWSKPDQETPEADPPWMRATSPLEGDFYTDELAGGEEKEVEIPEWLAGYAEGEAPPEGDGEETAEDEYTWLSATEPPPAPRSPLDLNKAAISQLESILGISHQIAKGIVLYRENHGPYRAIEDLINVPEIIDEQTIEILKPAVFISETQLPDPEPPAAPPVQPEPTPVQQKPAKKPAAKMNFEEILVTARARVSEKEIAQAAEQYSLLIKKKKFLDETIDDLLQAALDFPLEIAIHQTLGDAFMAKDLLDKALEAYSKAEDLLS